jgi:hypothetical protein
MTDTMTIDVGQSGARILCNGDRELEGAWQIFEFNEDCDYVYGVRGDTRPIWSIGRRADGCYFAAPDSRFYQNPRFECVWLR